MKSLPKWAYPAAAALVVVVLAVWAFTAVNGAQRTAVAKENALSAQYLDNQNELSSFVSKVHELMGVAKTNTEAIDQVLTDAVKGRYEGETGANPTGGAFFSAITEAYPDLAHNSALYGKVADAVSSGREAYKNKQTKLLDMLADYDTFRHAGLIHSRVVSVAGVPTKSLKAGVGDTVYTGEEAVDQMSRIVLAGDAKAAYETGEMEPLDLGPTD